MKDDDSKKTLTSEESRERLKTATITPAPSTALESFTPYVDRIMGAITAITGIKGAWILDPSCLSDFSIDAEDAAKIGVILGVSIDLDDANDNYIVKPAARLSREGATA
jgi:hypothetical protein